MHILYVRFIQDLVVSTILMFVLAVPCVWGQQQNTAVNATAAGDPSAAKEIDEYLSRLDKAGMPGCAAGAVHDGELVYKRSFGLANLDYGVPNTTTTRFNLASVSKPFTAMSIALLAQQGKLSLDDDIRKYVPEMPKYDDTITIRHLVHHMSGIREYQALVLFGGLGIDNAYSDKFILDMLARQKNVSFKPGSEHQYSNSNYFLLGTIVGRVSGKSLRAFAEENIFKPLGMKNTMYFDNRFEVVKDRAHGYAVGPGNNIRARSSLYDLVGGGGVLTTIEDLHLWTQNYFDPKVGNKETIELITTPGTLNNGEKIKYAFGVWQQQYKGLRMIEHSGNMMGYRAKIFSFPEQRFAAFALCNNIAILPADIVRKLSDTYLAGQLKPVEPGPKPAPVTLPPAVAISEKAALRYPGFYASKESGASFGLSFEDGKLVTTGLVQYKAPLVHIGENRLAMVAKNNKFELTSVESASGAVTEIRLTVNDGKPDIFVPVKPPLDSLAEYAGVYYSDELDAHYKLTLDGKDLVLRISEERAPTLTAAYEDVFTTAGGQISLVFSRDNQRRITGFVFNSGVDGRDVKGVSFKRR